MCAVLKKKKKNHQNSRNSHRIPQPLRGRISTTGRFSGGRTTRGIPRLLGVNLSGIGDDWRDSKDSGAESVGYGGVAEEEEEEDGEDE